MKKARDYAAAFISRRQRGDDDGRAVMDIVTALLLEIQEIADMRRAKSDAAIISIIEEQSRKWQAVIRRLPEDISAGMRPDGFLRMLRAKMPDLWNAMPDSLKAEVKDRPVAEPTGVQTEGEDDV